jgi:hypothetical protein
VHHLATARIVELGDVRGDLVMVFDEQQAHGGVDPCV